MEDTKVDNLRSKSLPSVRPGLYLWAEGDLRFCTASGKDTKSRKRTLGSGSKFFTTIGNSATLSKILVSLKYYSFERSSRSQTYVESSIKC